MDPHAAARRSGSPTGPGGASSLATRLFVWQLVLVTTVAVVVSVASYRNAEAQARDSAADRVMSVAATLAHDPFVVESVLRPDPSAALQPYAQEILATASVDFVTIMDTDRTRYTHPIPAQIGQDYIGSVDQALAGQPFVEEYAGTLGPSVRAIAPVRDDAGQITAMVAVGVTLKTLGITQSAAIPAILGVAAAAVALGGLAAYVLSRYLRRVTLGYGPEELRRLFAYYDSALHSLREGLVLVDGKGRLVLYNDHAADLLGLPPAGALRPLPVADLGLSESVRDLFASGRRATDEIHLTNSRVLVISQERAAEPELGVAPRLPFARRRGGRAGRPDRAEARRPGTVATLRDHTEIQALTGELETMKTLTEALRAQTHEHANRLHTVASLIELGREREALDFAVRDRQESQRLTDDVVQAIDEPFLTALLVGKAAQANERGIELTLTASGELPRDSLDARDLVTVTGNLLDNAFDAAAASDARRVWADFSVVESDVVISVADSGPGIDPDQLDGFLRLGTTTKSAGEAPGGHGLGLALVRQAVSRLGGSLEVDNDAGAIFTVTLPLRGGAAAYGRRAPDGSGGRSRG
ncbi:MAG: ATP-binding protein [Arthrobacter sp.]|uniref:sensor histidine kinase n=1 Tax=Arthrobacter sp. TaxID=1667 RepID=UPI00349176EE